MRIGMLWSKPSSCRSASDGVKGPGFSIRTMTWTSNWILDGRQATGVLPVLVRVFLLGALVTGCSGRSSEGGGGASVSVRGDGAGGGSVMVSGRRAQAEALDRTSPPAIGPVREMELPEMERLALSNGLDVVFVRDASLPVVQVELLLRGGASLAGPGREGLAALVADMLDEGTRTRSAIEIAEEVERLGASLVPTASHDASTVRLTVLSPRLGPGLDLLADVVLNPAFGEPDLDRVRSRRKNRILQRRDEPGTLADDAFAAVVFGTGHPYGQPLPGTTASLDGLDRDDVLSYYRRQYRPERATLVVVGDVLEDEVSTLLEDRFGGWGHGEGPAGDATEVEEETAAPPAADGPRERKVYLVDRPGAAQSEIRVGGIGVRRKTDDYHALAVLNTILGGAFTSRLNLLLREERGYTYGARSHFSMRVHPGPFTAAAAVHTPVTDSAVVDFIREIERLSTEAVPEEELERARNFVALRLPQQFETTGQVASRIAELALYDLPDDFHDGYVARALAVTAAEVQRAARAHLDTRRMAIVIAGDRAAIEEPLRRLDIGEVVVLEPTDSTGRMR